ncbi:hypothetical protein DdX_21971 [Ditylenchus destructor]|uniref:Uncharacterized protein n=1 Tax=Ditylenchus destructor TaxID=166010 RepID=A0AAD4MFJ3_9BILA|nr:hypothetical protein DdX_21971 [Ditylenchus destructor]
MLGYVLCPPLWLVSVSLLVRLDDARFFSAKQKCRLLKTGETPQGNQGLMDNSRKMDNVNRWIKHQWWSIRAKVFDWSVDTSRDFLRIIVMTSYFVPTSTVKCGELEVCPEGTVCLRPLLYTEPTVCVHRKFNLHENLLKSPCAEIPWFVAELVLMCACLVLLLVLFIMEIVKCCRGGRGKKSARNIEMSQLGNLGILAKNNIGMTYVYYNGRYVEQPSTSHAQPLDESQFVDVAIKYAEQSSTSQAQALDESQFVDAELMFATEIAAVVMIILSILFSIGLCFTGVYAIYIINTSVAIVMYCKVFYVHNCDFGVRCGNALGGAVAYSFLYMLVAMGFIVYFVRKPASIPSPYHIFLALLCLAFVVYQWYCIGLFYQDGQDHYRLWKARNCHNKYCTHTHRSNVPQQQWPIGKNQSRNFDPQTGSRTPYHKANPEMRTPGNQVNAVKIVENPMETYQNCNIYMHDANTNNATGTSSKSLNMDPEKGIQKSLEYPD